LFGKAVDRNSADPQPPRLAPSAGNPTQVHLSMMIFAVLSSLTAAPTAGMRVTRVCWRRPPRLHCSGCAIQLRLYPGDERRIFDTGKSWGFPW
jgi:hypothetical protein